MGYYKLMHPREFHGSQRERERGYNRSDYRNQNQSQNQWQKNTNQNNHVYGQHLVFSSQRRGAFIPHKQ